MTRRRLFFALWPGPETRALLYQLQQATGRVDQSSRYVPLANLHMTLHFIGNVDASLGDCLAEAARRVQSRAFTLTLDRIGHFKKLRIGWLGCRHVPTELVELHQRLADQLRPCDYQPESRRYQPHVTLARKQSVAGDAPVTVSRSARKQSRRSRTVRNGIGKR